MAESLEKTALKNIGYNSVAKAIAFAFQGAANVILSQNLSAADYGIVGFATIFVTFLARFNDLGIQSAVVQRAEVDDETLYTAFTAKALLGLAVYLIAFLIAGFARYFFDNPSVVTVIRLLSLNFLINTFAFLPKVLLNRELNFKKISVSDLSMSFASSLIAVVMVLLGFKFWSIVAATVLSNMLGVLVLILFRPVGIKLCFKKGIARELVGFGGKVFLTGLVVFLVFNVDNFVVGSAAGSAALGYYALAFNWGAMICMVLSDVVHAVLFPTFAKMQGDLARIRKTYLQVLEGVGFLAVLVNLTLFLGAEDFLYWVLGKGTEKWFPALTTFRIMCCYGMIRAMLEPVSTAILALGKSELMLKANLLAACLELALLYPVVKSYGIQGAAILIALAYLSQYLVYWRAMKRTLSIDPRDLVAALTPVVVPVAVVCAFFFLCRQQIAARYLLVTVPIGIACFVGLSGVLSGWKLIRQLKALVLGQGAK